MGTPSGRVASSSAIDRASPSAASRSPTIATRAAVSRSSSTSWPSSSLRVPMVTSAGVRSWRDVSVASSSNRCVHDRPPSTLDHPLGGDGAGWVKRSSRRSVPSCTARTGGGSAYWRAYGVNCRSRVRSVERRSASSRWVMASSVPAATDGGSTGRSPTGTFAMRRRRSRRAVSARPVRRSSPAASVGQTDRCSSAKTDSNSSAESSSAANALLAGTGITSAGDRRRCGCRCSTAGRLRALATRLRGRSRRWRATTVRRPPLSSGVDVGKVGTGCSTTVGSSLICISTASRVRFQPGRMRLGSVKVRPSFIGWLAFSSHSSVHRSGWPRWLSAMPESVSPSTTVYVLIVAALLGWTLGAVNTHPGWMTQVSLSKMTPGATSWPMSCSRSSW